MESKVLIFAMMSIPPWGFMVWANTAAGLIGCAVQLIGLCGLIYCIVKE